MPRFALLILVGLVACGPQAEPEASEPAPAPASAPAPAEAAAEVLYLDVRTPEEFATGHIAGAVNIPHDQMEARWEELAAYRERPVVVYCQSGRRSGLAIDVLQPKGFTNLENGGGFDQLAAKGLPTER